MLVRDTSQVMVVVVLMMLTMMMIDDGMCMCVAGTDS